MTDNIDAGEMAAKEMLTMLHDTDNSPQKSLEVGILLSSDASQAYTVGIAKTLTKQKRTDIVMVGFDMAEETKQFIKDPDYRGVSLMQKQDQMGYLGIGTLNSLINGKKSEQKYFDTGVIMIDSDYLMEKGVS